METLLCLSIALFAGLMLSRVAKIFQLPAVTAYLVAGILVGPYFLGSLGLNGFGFTSMANIDAYDMPAEFKNLQAQDMGKLGFMQDLVRGVCKIVGEKKTVIKETVIAAESTNIPPLLKRAFMFLEDGDFQSADEYCEKVLDNDPECAEAYLGKLMV